MAAAEVEGVDGDEGTVNGTSLSKSIVKANKSKANPSESPRRAKAGDHKHIVCKRAEESLEAATVHSADNLRIGELGCEGPELPGGCCHTYVTGSKGISHWYSGKNV